MGLIRTLRSPNIGRHLLRDEDEVIVDEVAHHWVAYWFSLIEVGLAVVLFVVVAFGPATVSVFPLVLGAALLLHAGWRFLVVSRDRFVITNIRVFRLQGVLSARKAIMPLSRILDITVVKPFVGRVLGYGHFTFESAAQEQGLRDIRCVPHPDERDRVIQQLVTTSGLRSGRRSAGSGSGS